MLLKKDTFKKAIEAIQKQSEKERTFCKALEPMIDGHFVSTMSSDIVLALLFVLEDVIDDTEFSWVEWWCYEKDFGKRKDLNAKYKDGKDIKLDTVDDLYDFLVDEYKEKNK